MIKSRRLYEVETPKVLSSEDCRYNRSLLKTSEMAENKKRDDKASYIKISRFGRNNLKDLKGENSKYSSATQAELKKRGFINICEIKFNVVISFQCEFLYTH